MDDITTKTRLICYHFNKTILTTQTSVNFPKTVSPLMTYFLKKKHPEIVSRNMTESVNNILKHTVRSH